MTDVRSLQLANKMLEYIQTYYIHMADIIQGNTFGCNVQTEEEEH